MNQKFAAAQLVPLAVELEFKDTSVVRESDYLTIDSLTVYFVVNYVNVTQRQWFKGHLAMIPLHWPDEFPLIKSSRIVVAVKFHHFRSGDLTTGEVEHEINIGSAEDKRSGIDSLNRIHHDQRPAYDYTNDPTRLLGAIFSITPKEKWEVRYKGQSIMKFTCRSWIKSVFNVKREESWTETNEIVEFVLYKKTWLGIKAFPLRIDLDSTKKYLLIIRDAKTRTKDGDFRFEWTNTPPDKISISTVFPNFQSFQ
jgi:hypothetical protein